MIIDCHNHADWCGYNLKRTIENMNQYQINKTWILTWECPASEFSPTYIQRVNLDSYRDKGPICLERCLHYYESYPDRFILGYACDPRRPDAIDNMNSAILHYGVKIYGELKLRMMLDDCDAIRMYRFCGEKGLPVTVHIDYEFPSGHKYPRPNYWYGGGMDAFERAIAKCPDTHFLGHAPGFWAHISGDDFYLKGAYPKDMPVVPGGQLIRMLDKYPNLYCDMSAGSGLCALTRDPKFARQFLIEYADRLLYGRDYFDNDLQTFLSMLNLPQDVLDKIYYKNALKLIHAL